MQQFVSRDGGQFSLSLNSGRFAATFERVERSDALQQSDE
jgi:hypothetical protein